MASAPTMHKFRGSITRPVHSRSTLRSFPPSAEVVRPRKTSFRLVVNLGRVGLATHKVPCEVSAFSTYPSSSPQALPVATAYLAKIGNQRLEKPFDTTSFKKMTDELVLAARSKRGT